MSSLTVYSDKYKCVTDQIFFASSVSYDPSISADTKEVRKSFFECLCVLVKLTACRTVGTSTAAGYASLQSWWLLSRAGKKTSEATLTGYIYCFKDFNLSFNCFVSCHIQRAGDIVGFLTGGFDIGRLGFLLWENKDLFK